MLPKNRVAACVHVYYEAGWKQIAEVLGNIPPYADIFVTCREEIAASLTQTVEAQFPQAEVIVFPNVGMDVLPFLLLCHEKHLHEYDAVLKLHTKNTKSDLRASQGEIMFDGLCGTPELTNDIIETFRANRNVGMVGTAFQLRSAHALMYGNREKMNLLLQKMEIDLSDWAFFTGTMFWIAGVALRDIALMAPQLLEQGKREEQGKTGGDGTLAHTLERVFGALSKSAGLETYVVERKDPDSGEYLVMPSRLHGPSNAHRFLELGSTDLLRRHNEASHWCKTIRDSGMFDSSYYAKSSSEYPIPGMDPLYHFVLYGDLFEFWPSAEFDNTYYQLRRRDVAREQICTLAHYLHMGKRENTPAMPNSDDWFEVVKRLGLFNADWYAQTYPDVELSGVAPETHYRVIGQYLGRASNMNFQPSKISSISTSYCLKEQNAVSYLRHHYLEEERLYGTLKRAVGNGDYAFVRSFARRIENQYGSSRMLREAQATYYTLVHDWEKARDYWKDFWENIETKFDDGRHGSSSICLDIPSRPLPNFKLICPNQNWEEKQPNASSDAQVGSRKICIYTTLFGDIDDLIPVQNPISGIDYICFTDRARSATGWKQIVVSPKKMDNNLNAKIFKILPHQYLGEYDASMFVDANTVFLGRMGELIDLCWDGGDFVMWQHPLREDTYVEAAAIIAHQRHSPEKIIKQVAHYAEEGLARNAGIFEASFIWRRHKKKAVSAFMEEWWSEITTHSARDQISLSYLVWKTGFRPALLSPELGTSRENIYFFKAPHCDGKVLDKEQQDTSIEAPAVLTKDRDITFLYDEAHRGTGSTVLRGEQLSNLVKARYKLDREVSYSSDTAIQNRIIVLTKGFLKSTDAEALHELGKHNVLVADFVDEPPKPELIKEIDVLMASSLLGYKSYMTRFPQVPTFHVTHHVDTRIPAGAAAKADVLRAGYFGEIVNTIRSPEIEQLVKFNLVDTSKQTNSWIDDLSQFNFHYACRRNREIDGAKPFLKGFVAAHCGANMMIQKTAGDAPFYLGSDYPYLLPAEATAEDIVEALRYAQETFGGREWEYGLQIMRDVAARSCVDYVMAEFTDMIGRI